MFNSETIRSQFPIFSQIPSLVYLDSAATTQKPKRVIAAIDHYYSNLNANIHRGVYSLSQKATDAYELARERVADFLGTENSNEIVFLRGTTEGINLIAQTFGRSHLTAGDEIIISELEHHSNIVPWQILAQQTGAILKVIPINDQGELIIEEFTKLLNNKTKLISVAHVSNALGTVNPIEEIIKQAHAKGVPVIIDGAQAAPHLKIDVKNLDCDFYLISGHKIYGPTGIGALYGKSEHLKKMPPYQGGGDMILSVSFEKTIYQEAPFKFEAGTPHIAGAIALGEAIEFIKEMDLALISRHEDLLLEKAKKVLEEIPGLTIIGNPRKRVGVISFVLDCAHPHDIGTVLDQKDIAIRTGHHCAQPLMERLSVPATARISFGIYNTEDELSQLAQGLHDVRKLFS